MIVDINNLLDKYWNGETTVEEEATIFNYFQSDSVADTHIQYKDYFDWIQTQKQIQSDSVIDIDALLEKYWDVTTTEKEEATLKAYFNSGKIDPNHLPYQDLFVFFEEQCDIRYSAPIIQLPIQSKEDAKSDKQPETPKIRILPALTRIAAVIIFVAGALFVINNIQQPNIKPTATAHVYEVEDPEEALRITREALALVSNKFKESQEPLKENLNTIKHLDIFKAE